MTFKEYMINWFHEFVEWHNSEYEGCENLFCQMGCNDT